MQELPEGFDAAVLLPGADPSSKESIMDTFPLVFLFRWLTLRSEVASFPNPHSNSPPETKEALHMDGRQL